jgi:acetylornithine deacetylase/succinyl-diaminopimelate desuccinylase-like protein
VVVAAVTGSWCDRPGLGKVIVGRGATNTKGPQMAVLSARRPSRPPTKLPVNIALVCEGEEEIGSPNFRQIVFKPEVEAALQVPRHHHPARQPGHGRR